MVLYNSLQSVTNKTVFHRNSVSMTWFIFLLEPHRAVHLYIKEQRSTVQIYADSMTWICFLYPLTPVYKFVCLSVVVNDMRFLRSRGQSSWISNIVGIFCPAASDTIGSKTNGCLYPTKSKSNWIQVRKSNCILDYAKSNPRSISMRWFCIFAWCWCFAL